MQTFQPAPGDSLLRRLTAAFEKRLGKTAAATLVAQAAVVGLGVLDYATGVRLQFAIVYLVPISFAALRGGVASGVITSAVSALAWFLAGWYGGADYGTGWVAWWNALGRMAGFSLTAVFLARSHRLNECLVEKAKSLSLEIEKRKLTERILDEQEILQLRKLSECVIEAQEAERRRIAADLHDSVNQLLSTITFRLGMITEQISGSHPEVTAELEKSKLLLAKGIEEIHRISEGLRPSELDALGLVPALRSLCREFQEKTGLALKFDLELSSERLSDAVELTLYRIIQEALNNIEKHSGASRATLHLRQNGSCLDLAIHDNGKGLKLPSGEARPSKTGGMGLLNMRERAAYLGGTFSLQSTVGKGTRILVQIPFLETVPDPSGKERTLYESRD